MSRAHARCVALARGFPADAPLFSKTPAAAPVPVVVARSERECESGAARGFGHPDNGSIAHTTPAHLSGRSSFCAPGSSASVWSPANWLPRQLLVQGVTKPTTLIYRVHRLPPRPLLFYPLEQLLAAPLRRWPDHTAPALHCHRHRAQLDV